MLSLPKPLRRHAYNNPMIEAPTHGRARVHCDKDRPGTNLELAHTQSKQEGGRDAQRDFMAGTAEAVK
jgi:hypothetical protein